MSNTTIKRRLSLYINGKEVGNNIKEIRAGMQTLVNEQAKMLVGSKAYLAHTQKIKSLKAIIQEHNSSLRETKKSWLSLSSVSDGFNRYSGMVLGLLGSMTGVILGFRKCADEAGKFEENLDNLSALTGLEGKNLEWLGDQATAMSIKTTDAGIKIKQSATDIVDAFTKMGSQRPELLANKEALRAVTENAIILSEAAKMKLEPATESLANVMNQFGLEASDSRRVINELAAGSKFGAGNIQYLSDAIEKCGTSASLMGIETNQAIGIIEAFAPKFKEASLAGNSLDKVLLKMRMEQIGFTSGVFNMSDALKELQANLNPDERAKMFGVEHIKMVEVLIEAQDDVIKYTEAVTGTEIALEQAFKNTNNSIAKRAQAMNKLSIQMRKVGEEIAPSIVVGTNAFTYFLNVISRAPELYKEHKSLIYHLIAAYIVYQGITIKNTIVTTANRVAQMSLMGAIRQTTMHIDYLRISEVNAAKSTTLLAYNTRKLRAVFSVLWRAMAANPIGLIVVGIFALGKAFDYLESISDSALKAEELRASIMKKTELATDLATKANNKYAESIENINTMTREDRKDTIDSLAKDIDKATKALNDQRYESNKFAKSQAKPTKTQFIWTTIRSGSSDKAFNKNVKKQETNNLEEFWDSDKGVAMKEQNKKLEESLKLLKQKQQIVLDINNLESKADKIGNETTGQLDEKIKLYAKVLTSVTANSEEAIRVNKKLAESQKLLSNFGKPTGPSEDDLLKAKKEAEAKAAAEKIAVMDLAKSKYKAEQDLATTIREIREKQHLETLSDSEKEIYETNKKYTDLLAICKQFDLDSSEVLSAYKSELDQIYFKLADMNVGQLQEIKPTSAGADIFGMTEDDWDTLEGKVSTALDLAGQLTSVWDSFNQIQANRENQELQDYEDSCNKKKDLLNKQLNAGKISQEQYNARTAALDSDLDKRKAEFAKKQAKRDRQTAFTNILINTASAIMRIWADTPKVDWGIGTMVLTGIAAATGIAQAAVIASQPLPEFAKGGLTDGARMYIAGEAGQEWISPNWMLKDKRTAPMINRLEAVRTGIISPDHLVPSIPDFKTMTSIPMFASGGYTGSSAAAVQNYYSQTTANTPDPNMASMNKNIERLCEYLSDPKNRRATISNDVMNQNNKEAAELNRLRRI